MPYTPKLPQVTNRYEEAFKDPKGAGDRRPTALQVAQDEGVIGKLGEKVALVTGGTSGIGVEIVRVLAKTGAKVFFTARDLSKAEKVKSQIQSEDASAKLDVIEMDLKDLESVKKGAEDFLSKTDRLDIFVSNAGIAATPHGFTKQGFEQQFGVNYLAPFYLFHHLKPLLLKTAAAHGPVRVVCTSSTSHTASTVLPEDNYGTPNPNGKGYEPGVSYAHSNTAKIWFANEAERRYGSKGVHFLSVHPGGFSSGLMDSSDDETKKKLEEMIKLPHIQKVWQTVEQGAATSIMASIGKEYEGVGGFYMEKCGIAPPLPDDAHWAGYGYKSWAYDEEGEKKLWADSLKMTGLQEDA